MKEFHFVYNIGNIIVPSFVDTCFIVKSISAADLRKLLIGRTIHSYISDLRVIDNVNKNLEISLEYDNSPNRPLSPLETNGVFVLVQNQGSSFHLWYDITGIIDELGILENL